MEIELLENMDVIVTSVGGGTNVMARGKIGKVENVTSFSSATVYGAPPEDAGSDMFASSPY